jgi:hypothetical protein
VFNGNGRGTLLQKINEVGQDVIGKLTYREVFLDSATGDFYNYNHSVEQFVPIGNTGIHNHKAAEEHSHQGGIML